MICTKCGKDNAEGLKFCTNCGKRIAPSITENPALKAHAKDADLPMLDDSSVQPIPNTAAPHEPHHSSLSLASNDELRVPNMRAPSEGRNCPICDAPLPDEFRFCVNCGAKYSQYDIAPIQPGDEPPQKSRVSTIAPDSVDLLKNDTHAGASDAKSQIVSSASNSAISSAELLRLSSADLSGARRAIERISFVPSASLPQKPENTAPFSLFHVNDDGSLGDQILINPGENIIGRTSSALMATDHFVSPRHLRITCNSQSAVLEDCSTMNGSFIKIANETIDLQNGDIFRIGEELLCYFHGDSNQPLISNPTHENTALLGGKESPGWGYLRVIMGAHSEGNVYRLSQPYVTLGRVNADIRFPRDGFVSGTHAALRLNNNTVTLSDLDSSNGTFIRMRRSKTVTKTTFILIGNQLLRLSPNTH